MTRDSIIASPTNKVRVMVEEASGCWASAVSANATALPCASDGPMAPIAVVIPAMTIDTTATIVMLSTVSPLCCDSSRCNALRRLMLGFTNPGRGRDVHSRQDAEYISLHHAGQLAEQGHDDRKDEGCNRDENADNQSAAHHIAEQTDRQRERSRKFADDVKRQHQRRRRGIGLEVVEHALLLDAEERHGHEHRQRERGRGRERGGRRIVAGNHGTDAGRGDKYEERSQKAEKLPGLTQGHFFHFFFLLW